jgi:hypothetical protein
MEDDIKQWLQQEYEGFERQFFFNLKFWRVPIETLKGTQLYDLFDVFKTTFPDHPSDTNTVFYLTESVGQTPLSQTVLLWCSHFEHSALEDLRSLTSFMHDTLNVESTEPESAFLSKLDGIGECIVLSFLYPIENIVKLLKARGARGGVEQESYGGALPWRDEIKAPNHDRLSGPLAPVGCCCSRLRILSLHENHNSSLPSAYPSLHSYRSISHASVRAGGAGHWLANVWPRSGRNALFTAGRD